MEKQDRVQRAVELFMSGYGCCQSVVAAFCDEYGLDETMAKRIAAGFGGGVGRMRMMCGTVSALVILSGLRDGQTDAGDARGKAQCYKKVQELLQEFQKQNGSLICAELLGLEGKPAFGDFVPAPRNEEYYRIRPCAAKVESAARIWAQQSYISPAIKTVSIDASDALMQCSPNSADSDWTDGSGNVNDYEI